MGLLDGLIEPEIIDGIGAQRRNQPSEAEPDGKRERKEDEDNLPHLIPGLDEEPSDIHPENPSVLARAVLAGPVDDEKEEGAYGNAERGQLHSPVELLKSRERDAETAQRQTAQH